MSNEINLSGLNPLYGKISDIFLKKDGNAQSLISILRTDNNYCRFEKIEMVESVYEYLPKGSLIVRDVSDIISYIKLNELDTIIVQYIDNTLHSYSITSTTYVNNAASEKDQNIVSINFSNHFYKFTQENSVSNLMNTPKPYVDYVHKQIKQIVYTAYLKMVTLYQDFIPPNYKSNLIDDFNCSNFALYKPLNPMEYRFESPNDNIMQYMGYLANGACQYYYNDPRYLLWSNLDNEVYFQYFFENIQEDTVNLEKLETFNHRFAVYDNDSPEILDRADGKIYKKIYVLTTEPADQFISKKYFYIRKTPKILNKQTTSDNNDPVYDYTKEIENLTFQFQDEGQKYDIEIVSSDGIKNYAPRGADELVYKGFWGFYDNMNPVDSTSLPTHIGQDYGTQNVYAGNTHTHRYNAFMGLSAPFPYVDNTDMWKNIFDLTPIHPHIPKLNSNPLIFIANQNNLQRVIDLRYDTFIETKGITRQLEQIRQIEKQNFIYYVLCCIGEQEDDETFFAAITGYKQEQNNLARLGVNNENLRYLYQWKRLNYTNTIFNGTSPNQTPEIQFRDFMHPQGWTFGAEGTTGDDITTWAINLNERSNYYNADGITGYYGPGWYAKNLVSTLTDVTYRPIGQGIGELDTIPRLTSERLHIVRMTKTPIKKLLNEAGITQAGIYASFANKYLYTFDAQNITDGPCPSTP